MQKVLTMITSRNTMRAEVEGWSSEDGDAVRDYWTKRRTDPSAKQYAHINDMPVGLIGGSMPTSRLAFPCASKRMQCVRGSVALHIPLIGAYNGYPGVIDYARTQVGRRLG